MENENYWTWVFINNDLQYCEIEKILGGWFLKNYTTDSNSLHYIWDYPHNENSEILANEIITSQKLIISELKNQISIAENIIDNMNNQIKKLNENESPLKY
jgi:hypothetical protein